MSLLEKLKNYSQSGVIPMHMPGHKRNDEFSCGLPFNIDITEIDGFDNLHGSDGILLELADKCAELYKCKRAFPLVNGTTCGILAAISAVAKHGSTIIAARNCHKSVYNAIVLNRLHAEYIMPPQNEEYGINGSICPDDVESAIKLNPSASCVIITSPTYEGVVSDISAISKICHKYSLPLIVDQAHGAHFGFCDELPSNALDNGADIVIMSLHKTLPSMTQTALLCTNSPDEIIDRLGKQLSVFETSSPSYVLLASIENCISVIKSRRCELFSEYIDNLRHCYVVLQNLQKLSIISPFENKLPFFDFDIGKFVISTEKSSISGPVLAEILRRDFSIEVEMSSSDYIIAMTSICDTAENLQKFCDAVISIDKQISFSDFPCNLKSNLNYYKPIPVLSAWEIPSAPVNSDYIRLIDAENKISAEYVWAYPPGIPLVVPGELISTDVISHITRLSECGVTLHSDSGKMPNYILCTDRPL